MTSEPAKKLPRPTTNGHGETKNGKGDANGNPFADMMSNWMSANAFQATGTENFSAMSKASSEAMKGAMGLFQETGRFVSDRIQKDVDALRALGACRSPEDYFRVQADFFDTAIRDYADETSKVAQLAAETTQCAYGPLQERTSKVLHDMQAEKE